MTIENISNSVIDSSAVTQERIANARSYMTSVLNNSITLPIDTASKFVTIDGSWFPIVDISGVCVTRMN